MFEEQKCGVSALISALNREFTLSCLDLFLYGWIRNEVFLLDFFHKFCKWICESIFEVLRYPLIRAVINPSMPSIHAINPSIHQLPAYYTVESQPGMNRSQVPSHHHS